MNTLMDPVFAMDEIFSFSRGSRLDQLRNALELTTITPLLGRCRREDEPDKFLSALARSKDRNT
jgi:hypothetical protein